MKIQKWLLGGVILGLVSLAWIYLMSPIQFWPTVLLIGIYTVSLALGGVLFIAIQNISGANWDKKIRIVPETLARCFWIPSVLILLALFFGWSQFYGWVGQEGSHSSPSHFREAWLSARFLLVRAIIILVLWGIFVARVRSFSSEQNGRKKVRWSAGFLVVFGMTFSLASFDWLMSVEPGWTSTIFAIYVFSGLYLSILAAIAALAILLRRLGPLQNILTEEHLHDLGKLIFGFSMFWAYIWYCQYLLVWYTNLPEETSFFLRRHSGGWAVLSFINVALNWLVPFIALLSKRAKRNEAILFSVSLIIIIGHWLDLHIILMPRFVQTGLSMVIGQGLVFLGAVASIPLLFFVILTKEKKNITARTCQGGL